MSKRFLLSTVCFSIFSAVAVAQDLSPNTVIFRYKDAGHAIIGNDNASPGTEDPDDGGNPDQGTDLVDPDPVEPEVPAEPGIAFENVPAFTPYEDLEIELVKTSMPDTLYSFGPSTTDDGCGFDVDPATGNLSGYPNGPTGIPCTIEVVAQTGESASFTRTPFDEPSFISLPETTPEGIIAVAVGQSFSEVPAASLGFEVYGGNEDLGFSLSGQPGWLDVTPEPTSSFAEYKYFGGFAYVSRGNLVGNHTFTQVGVHDYVIQAIDSEGRSASRDLVIDVVEAINPAFSFTVVPEDRGDDGGVTVDPDNQDNQVDEDDRTAYVCLNIPFDNWTAYGGFGIDYRLRNAITPYVLGDDIVRGDQVARDMYFDNSGATAPDLQPYQFASNSFPNRQLWNTNVVYEGTNSLCARIFLTENFTDYQWRYINLDIEFTSYPEEAIIRQPGDEPYVDPEWEGSPQRYRFFAGLPLANVMD